MCTKLRQFDLFQVVLVFHWFMQIIYLNWKRIECFFAKRVHSYIWPNPSETATVGDDIRLGNRCREWWTVLWEKMAKVSLNVYLVVGSGKIGNFWNDLYGMKRGMKETLHSRDEKRWGIRLDNLWKRKPAIHTVSAYQKLLCGQTGFLAVKNYVVIIVLEIITTMFN